MSELMNPLAGVYQHYKGSLYEVLFQVKHSETLEDLIVYHPIDDGYQFWARPRNVFFGKVIVDGRQVERFKRVDHPDGCTNNVSTIGWNNRQPMRLSAGERDGNR
jgi:hypothetical protein